MIPTGTSGLAARSTGTARPCASSWWCATVNAPKPSRSPGAWLPSTCPLKACTTGSFSVIHIRIRSPSASATTAAYSANRSAVSRASQPPASCSGCGRSQWKSVAAGATPAASSASTSRV